MAKKKKYRRQMSEFAVQTLLKTYLNNLVRCVGGNAKTFKQRMVVTDNKGVVLNFGNGQEFQLTIVESN